MTQKIKNSLEIATSVAVILVAIVVLTTFVRGYFNQNPQPQIQTGLQRGQQLTNLTSVISHSNDNQTILLVAMTTTCHFCEESIPFYNQLAETFQKTSGSPAFLAVFPNPEDQVRTYAARQQLKMPTLAAVDFNSLKVNGTPTMIWLDHTGKILDFWVGKPSKTDEQQILKTLGLISG